LKILGFERESVTSSARCWLAMACEARSLVILNVYVSEGYNFTCVQSDLDGTAPTTLSLASQHQRPDGTKDLFVGHNESGFCSSVGFLLLGNLDDYYSLPVGQALLVQTTQPWTLTQVVTSWR